MIEERVATHSEQQTRSAGARLAAELEPGDVVLLVGGLGAGKTTFVQGLAGGLGYTGEVTSPTFTLVQTYRGRLDVMHADLWRLERLQELIDLALDEGLESGGVLVAEWGEGALELFGADALVVHFGPGRTEADRELTFEALGPSFARRMAA